MVAFTRRRVLQHGVVAVGSVVTGCSHVAPSLGTPSPGNCTEAPRPHPTPTQEGLEPQSYPEYPDQIRGRSAKHFALDFEFAYQYNSFLTEDFIPGTDEIDIPVGVPEDGVTRAANGFTVAVNGTLFTGDRRQDPGEPDATETESPAPALMDPFGAWYRCTDRIAHRLKNPGGPIEAPTRPPEFESRAMVIVCRGV